MSAVRTNQNSQVGVAPAVTVADPVRYNSPSRGRQVAGAVIGGAANIVAPGLGSALGNLIAGNGWSGNPVTGGDFQLDSLQAQMATENRRMLLFQYQMNLESRQFESTANALKARHEASMAAVRNFK